METPIENLHYALGELAYAMAAVDGKVQPSERKKFHDIVAAEVRCKDYGFDISDIIFRILDHDKQLDVESMYTNAMHVIRVNSHYLSPELKATFLIVLRKIAKAFPPVTNAESAFLERFERDIEPINGDPVFYNHK